MLSESAIKTLAQGWLSIAGHAFAAAKDGNEYRESLEGCFQNAIRQAAEMATENERERQAKKA